LNSSRPSRSPDLVDGRNCVLNVQFAVGDYEMFPEMARNLAQAGARMILVHTIASARATQNVDPPVPVVVLNINDPAGTGLVASLARTARVL
jgi:putative ABC transport system substrate-binding protein